MTQSEKVLVVAFDGVDKELIEKHDCRNILEMQEFGFVDNDTGISKRVTSDHGENFDYERNLWGHYGVITEDLVHVPLVISGVGNKKVEDNFPLKNIKNLVENLCEGNFSPILEESIKAEYEGLDSHVWDLEKDEFNDLYFQSQIFTLSNGLERP